MHNVNQNINKQLKIDLLYAFTFYRLHILYTSFLGMFLNFFIWYKTFLYLVQKIYKWFWYFTYANDKFTCKIKRDRVSAVWFGSNGHYEDAEDEFYAVLLPTGLRSGKCLECIHVVAGERRLMYVVRGYVSTSIGGKSKVWPTWYIL